MWQIIQMYAINCVDGRVTVLSTHTPINTLPFTSSNCDYPSKTHAKRYTQRLLTLASIEFGLLKTWCAYKSMLVEGDILAGCRTPCTISLSGSVYSVLYTYARLVVGVVMLFTTNTHAHTARTHKKTAQAWTHLWAQRWADVFYAIFAHTKNIHADPQLSESCRLFTTFIPFHTAIRSSISSPAGRRARAEHEHASKRKYHHCGSSIIDGEVRLARGTHIHTHTERSGRLQLYCADFHLVIGWISHVYIYICKHTKRIVISRGLVVLWHFIIYGGGCDTSLNKSVYNNTQDQSTTTHIYTPLGSP